eukprot:Gb_03712 [translate_table: standard]
MALPHYRRANYNQLHYISCRATAPALAPQVGSHSVTMSGIIPVCRQNPRRPLPTASLNVYVGLLVSLDTNQLYVGGTHIASSDYLTQRLYKASSMSINETHIASSHCLTLGAYVGYHPLLYLLLAVEWLPTTLFHDLIFKVHQWMAPTTLSTIATYCSSSLFWWLPPNHASITIAIIFAWALLTGASSPQISDPIASLPLEPLTSTAFFSWYSFFSASPIDSNSGPPAQSPIGVQIPYHFIHHGCIHLLFSFTTSPALLTSESTNPHLQLCSPVYHLHTQQIHLAYQRINPSNLVCTSSRPLGEPPP